MIWSDEIIFLNFGKFFVFIARFNKLFCTWVTFRSSILSVTSILDGPVLNLIHSSDLSSSPLSSILIDRIIHRLPLTIEITSWSQIALFLNLRKITTSSVPLTVSSKLNALVFSKEKNCLETHGFTLKSSIGNIVVTWCILHHIVNTALTLVRVQNLLDPSSGRWSVVFIFFLKRIYASSKSLCLSLTTFRIRSTCASTELRSTSSCVRSSSSRVWIRSSSRILVNLWSLTFS